MRGFDVREGKQFMSIIFRELGKQLALSIDGYEFDHSDINNNYYDANWLRVRVDYSENRISHTYKDSCLLASELRELTKDIDNIINGSETGLITDFLEPYLKFAVTAVRSIYAVQVRFVYDTSQGWKDIYISQAMTLEELRETNDHLKQLSAKYPVRKGQE